MGIGEGKECDTEIIWENNKFTVMDEEKGMLYDYNITTNHACFS